MAREASLQRKTAETEISLHISLDGTGTADLQTGVGFLDHMLTLFAKHGLFDLSVRCTGDTQIDDHHSVEDIGIVLGQALRQAVGDKRSIVRYGSFTCPMDEALVAADLDLSGRPYLAYGLELDGKIGSFDAELVREFMQALTNNLQCNLHLRQLAGGNRHHVAEAAFKATARALDVATSIDPRVHGVPSTKGSLE
ncbi:MAG: imidazoleglycerol-phosphate dehydratase HisB [Fimbriimonadaceae bacterium]|nr:imidazoleglycerol-phosphate dehydratase HisB [Fimbriimonadaceae bacterium]